MASTLLVKELFESSDSGQESESFDWQGAHTIITRRQRQVDCGSGGFLRTATVALGQGAGRVVDGVRWFAFVIDNS